MAANRRIVVCQHGLTCLVAASGEVLHPEPPCADPAPRHAGDVFYAGTGGPLRHSRACRSKWRTTLAGFPAATQFGGTSRVTTAPAATTERSPTVTPASTLAPKPMNAPFL